MGAAALAEGVKASGTLTVLLLSGELRPGASDRAPRGHSSRAHAASDDAGNQIGDVGAAALAEGVTVSRTLTELSLYGVCVFGVGFALVLGTAQARRVL